MRKFFRLLLVIFPLLVLFSIISAKSVSASTQGKILFRFVDNNVPQPTNTLATINLDGTGFTTIPFAFDDGGWPQLSPDGTKIVFMQVSASRCSNPDMQRSDIFVMNSDGTNVRNLTANLSCNQWASPSWFPDGTKIVFNGQSFNTPTSDLYSMDLTDGTVQKIIANGHFGNISPDGRKVAYTSLDLSFIPHIFVADIDGSHPIDLTPDANSTYYFSPHWSPDGQKIAVVDGNGGLYVMNYDGTNRMQIHQSGGVNTAGTGFTWSSDSTRIIFTATDNELSNGAPNQIFSLPVSGGTPTIIYQVPNHDVVNQPTLGKVFVPGPNVAPDVHLFPNGTPAEGSTYATNGFLLDPDSTTWTATVDYGDGTALQPLALSGVDFLLSHIYKDNGTYTVTVAITDDQGATGTSSMQVTVNNVAPQVDAITAPATPTQVNTTITASANFNDVGVLDTHTASWNWGDGSITTGTVTETNGSGSVLDTHTYTVQGVYPVTLTVTDKDGGQATATYQYITIYNTSTKSVSGSKEFISPQGAVTQDPTATGKVNFGFTAQYDSSGNVIPTGNKWASLMFTSGNTSVNFNATAYQWLVVTGAKAVLKGTGTLNNVTGFSVLISAIDGSQTNGVDLIRYQIKDSSGNVVYDTQPGAGDTADPTTPVSKGKVTIK